MDFSAPEIKTEARKMRRYEVGKKMPLSSQHLNILTSMAFGFTLIELMVVIVIIGLLAALVAPRLMNRADDARVTEAKIQIKNFETALRLFKTDNGFYPSTEQGLEALILPPSEGQIPENFREGGYLEKRNLPPDPWGNRYVYLSPGRQGEYDIICLGADAQPGGSGYNADIINWEI